MNEYLHTQEGNDSLYAMLESRGLIKKVCGSDQLVNTAILLAWLVRRTDKSLVHSEPDCPQIRRFHNTVADLVSLGVLAPDEAPARCAEHDGSADDEVKCVRLWDKYLSASWSTLGNYSEVVPRGQPFGQEGVIMEFFNAWEIDFLFAIRIFARFKGLAPLTWEYTPNHITLIWQYGSGFSPDNFLVPHLVSEFDGFGDIELSQQDQDFINCLRTAADPAHGMTRHRIQKDREAHGMARPRKGFLGLFGRKEPTPQELADQYHEAMLALANAADFE